MDTMRNKRWLLPTFGIFAAIATNTLANAGANSALGVLFLLPLLVTFWCVERFSRREVGFVHGPLRHYGLGLLHPLLVLSCITLVAWLTGAVNLDGTNWSNTALEFIVNALVTTLLTTVTEDGFFRGWLWASMRRAGLNEHRVVLVTGIAFGVWHLPYTLLTAGYTNVSAEAPLLIITASIIGISWGLLRLHSGSVFVPAVIHGMWNAAVYGLFNSGGKVGALGIQNVTIFGPEAGVLGLVLNLGFAVGLWWWYSRTASTRVVLPSGRSQPEPIR